MGKCDKSEKTVTGTTAMITASRKNELRELYLARRERETKNHPEFRALLNAAVLDWLGKERVSSIGFYWPFRAEPGISQAVRAWLAQNPERRAALPVIDDKNNGLMHFAAWKPDTAMRVGAYGIAIPKDDVKVVPEIVFLPCVAFNENGVRLGSGAGFFDRYLTSRSRDPLPPVTVAVSFEMLRCEELQAERHDVLCDWIATEAGVRRVG